MRIRSLYALLWAQFMAMWLGLAVAPAASAAAHDVPHGAALAAPVDLQRDAAQAARRGQPVIILFSMPDCPYCQVVRRNYLAPLTRDLPPAERPVVREVDLTGTATFAGFRKERISHRDFASAYHIRFAPTVVLLDASGRLLTQPIVGGDTVGLYGGYLDNALAEAARKLAESGRNKN